MLLMQGGGQLLISLGRLSGLLGVYFILMQFLLMGRSFWLERTFGLDNLSRVHHLNGQFSIILILLHPILLTAGYAAVSKQNLWLQFLTLLDFEDVLKALGGLLLFVLIVFFSIYIVRKKLKYEIWYLIHLFTYLAIFLAWGHQLKNGGDFLRNSLFASYWSGLYLFVFGNHLIFRFLRPLYLFIKHGFFISRIERETGETTSVYIAGKQMEDFKVEAGQFLILRFLTKDFWWQAHPFSLSQTPNNQGLRFTIKSAGDFTAKILDLKTGAKVIIDGPFGTFTERANKKVLLIAGGIGITPIYSLLGQMVRHRKNVILFYSNQTKDDIVFQKEIEQLKRKYKFTAHYFLSRERNKNYLWGRITKEKIKQLVKDVTGREIYLCGPIEMMSSLKKDLLDLGVFSSAIHYEKFSL